MSETNELDIEKLYETYTSQEQVKESFDKFTVPTGRYTFTASKPPVPEAASDKSPWPGRQIVRLFGKLSDDEGARKGSVGMDASWEVHRRENGKLDGPSKLWGQIVTALGMAEKSVGEVIAAAGSYPLSVYVTEGFKTPEGWRTARDAEKRSEYRKLGYEARNFVDSVSKAR